jgi:predicted amidohydrolase
MPPEGDAAAGAGAGVADRYRVAVVQPVFRAGDPAGTLARAEALVGRAAADGAALVVLPEGTPNALPLPHLGTVAERLPGPTSDRLAALARACRVYLAVGLAERDGDRLFSTAVLFGPDGGLLARYRRIYLYSLERHFLTPGDDCPVVETPLGRLGLMMGYDLHFPEVTRRLLARGAEVILCPALLLRRFAPAIRQLALARATENACYLILASAAGENTLANLTFMGGSALLQGAIGVDVLEQDLCPQDPVLAQADTAEAVIAATLRLDRLRRIHAASPLQADWRACPFSNLPPSMGADR